MPSLHSAGLHSRGWLRIGNGHLHWIHRDRWLDAQALPLRRTRHDASSPRNTRHLQDQDTNLRDVPEFVGPKRRAHGWLVEPAVLVQVLLCDRRLPVVQLSQVRWIIPRGEELPQVVVFL